MDMSKKNILGINALTNDHSRDGNYYAGKQDGINIVEPPSDFSKLENDIAIEVDCLSSTINELEKKLQRVLKSTITDSDLSAPDPGKCSPMILRNISDLHNFLLAIKDSLSKCIRDIELLSNRIDL